MGIDLDNKAMSLNSGLVLWPVTDSKPEATFLSVQEISKKYERGIKKIC